MSIDKFKIIKKLGSEEFSRLYLCSDNATKNNYAVKMIEMPSNNLFLKYLNNEIYILKQIDHPNVVKLIEWKKTPTHYIIVMEYYNNKDLGYHLEESLKTNKKPFDENVVQYLMKQIVNGLKYLHDKDIIHRDIKLSNIVLDLAPEKCEAAESILNSKVKITNFTFARYLSKSELAYSVLGAPLYMDPIILLKYNKIDNNKEIGYDRKCDIWSLGVMCYELLIGEAPFDANNKEELVKKVEKGNYYLPINISQEAFSFINGMLQYDPKKRYNIDDLCNHPFLKKHISEFTKIDCKKDSKLVIVGDKIKMNTKSNLSKEDEKDIKINELEKKVINLQNEIKEERNKNENYLKIIKSNGDLEKYIKKELSEKNLRAKINTAELDLNNIELEKEEKWISVNFTTIDEKMHYSIICKKTDKFSKIEEQFYKDNPKYNKNEHHFMNGNKIIDNSKTLDDNDIHNNSIIIIK